MKLFIQFIRLAKIPALMVALMWFVHITKWMIDADISSLGVYPRTLMGSSGILFGPMIHGDMAHLISNSVPLLLLGAALYYGYEEMASKVLVLIYLLSGLLVWLLAREAHHIGASGVVYGLFGFVVSGGLLAKQRSLTVIGMAVFVLYGGVFYGIFPNKPGISWESHLLGLMIGVVLAIFLARPNMTETKATGANANHTYGSGYYISYDYRELGDKQE
ncbi:MAG: rhomboid family intramembrane serine protease [Cyclobacteriaceae bacterium]